MLALDTLLHINCLRRSSNKQLFFTLFFYCVVDPKLQTIAAYSAVSARCLFRFVCFVDFTALFVFIETDCFYCFYLPSASSATMYMVIWLLICSSSTEEFNKRIHKTSKKCTKGNSILLILSVLLNWLHILMCVLNNSGILLLSARFSRLKDAT